MKSRFLFLLFLGLVFFSCKKDENPVNTSETFPVSAVILNPAGTPQGGAILTLKNPPSSDPKFAGISDTSGRVTIQSPAGAQVLIAKIGSVFLTEMSVNVQASSGGTNAGSITLRQNIGGNTRVLIVKASAERLENVLRDPKIGFTTYDSTTVSAMRDSAVVDSTRLLNFLKQYTLIFSNCDGSSESGYPLLSRVYGRYVAAGGKMYGGHYNYYNMRVIWPGFYRTADSRGNTSTDTLQIVDPNLQTSLGFSIMRWSGTDSRRLSGYEKFSDLPTNTKVYGIIRGLNNPQVAVICENYVGLGKYLWTDYHNQDIINEPQLIKIVQYFLYSL